MEVFQFLAFYFKKFHFVQIKECSCLENKNQLQVSPFLLLAENLSKMNGEILL